MPRSSTFLQQLGRRFVFYLGGAWVVVESFSFLVHRYDLDPGLIDLLILLVLFGFPATFIFSSFRGRWNWKAIVLQVSNATFAVALIFYYIIHPNILNPEKLRFLKISKEPTSEAAGLKGIAVLPFLNNMGDDEEFLVSGMHDGLIAEIGKLGKLKVISRTSVMPYANSEISMGQIGKELNVSALIETSITRVDTMIALQMKLVNLEPEESILWTDSYEVGLGGIPNLFREVTKNVAEKINKVLTPEEKKKLTPQPPVNAEGYEAFLRGKHYTGFLTPENFEKAEEHFFHAIELDSTLVEAYTGLCVLWASKRQMGYVHPQMARDTIHILLEKASRINSENAQLLAQFAVEQTWGTFEWEKAERNFRKSTRLNPNDAGVRVVFAHFLMIMRRWEEAWDQARYAESLDPESPWVVSFIGVMYAFDGKILTGAKYIEKLKRIAPNHPLVAEVNLAKATALNQHDEAVKQLKILLQRTQIEGIDKFIDRSYAKKDFQTTLSETAAYLEEKKKTQFIQTRLIAQLYDLQGNVDKLMEMILIMHKEGDPSLPYLMIGPFKKHENHPIFRAVIQDIGLWEINKKK